MPGWLEAAAFLAIGAGFALFGVWAFGRRARPGLERLHDQGDRRQLALLDNLPLALLVHDADGSILRVNPAFEALFGYAASEVLGRRNDGFLTVPEDRPILRGLVASIRASGVGVAEFRGLRRDGSTFWIRASARRADEMGEGIHLLTGEDITEVRRAREEADLARDRYRELVESASDLVWSVDAEGRWTFLNAAAGELYGVEPTALLGTSLTDRSAPENRTGDERALRRLFEGGETWRHETVHVAGDGRRIHLGFSGRPVLEGGRVVGARGTARDVSSQVASREALTHVVRQQSLIQTFLAATPDIIFFKDQNGVYRGCNEAFAQLVGRPVGEIVGKSDYDLSSQDLADHYAHGDQEAFAAGIPLTIPSWETLPSGETVYLETIKAPFFNPDGEPMGIVGIARDATERKRTSEGLEAVVEETLLASRQKSAFLASLSHEIRTPLNGVLGMTDLLLDTRLSEDQRKSAGLIRSSARALLATLNDVLDLSHIQAGTLGLETVDFELGRVVEGAAGALGVEALSRGNDVLVDVAEDVPRWVSGDPVRLRQVLTKLVESSMRFTEAGAIVVRVRRAGGGGGNRLTFSVTDTGRGIPPAQLKAIRQGFPDTEGKDGTLGGVGLGLSVARELVHMMGGRLVPASAPGRGNELTFEITLPEADMDGEAGAPLRLLRLEGIDVLVVDDNAVNRRILREFLEGAGATVEDVAGADAAMDLALARHAKGRPFDIMLVDSLMPDKDGFDLARMLRDEAATAAAPIVLATSAGDAVQEARAREAGVDAVLTKPVSRSELLLTLSATLGREVEGPAVLITPALVERRIPRRRVLVVHPDPEWRAAVASLLRHRGHHVDVADSVDAAPAPAATGEARPWEVIFVRVTEGPAGPRDVSRFRERPGGAEALIVGVGPWDNPETAGPSPEEGGTDRVLDWPVEHHDLLGIVEGWGGAAGGPRAARTADEDNADDAEAIASAPIEAAVAERAGPALDLAAFEADMRTALVASAVPEVLGGFREEADHRFRQLSRAVAEGRHRSAAQVARAYRAAAAHLKARGLSEALARVEAAGRRGDADRLEALVDEVAMAQAEVLEAIEGALPWRR